jgi:hypothetical protein
MLTRIIHDLDREPVCCGVSIGRRRLLLRPFFELSSWWAPALIRWGDRGHYAPWLRRLSAASC